MAITTSAGCVPHFGGNQLPLYPFFITMIWFIFGENNQLIVFIQSFVASFAVVYLTHAILRVTNSGATAFLCGIVLAISPIEANWARFLLTETLAIATTQWVMAELLLSFAERRLRVIAVGIALIAATWIRMDGILLFVPVGVAAIYLMPFKKGVQAAVLAVMVACAPSLGWAVRNVMVGLPALPVCCVLPDGSLAPDGYMKWVRTWAWSEHQRANATNFDVSNYFYIKIAPIAYRNDDERGIVEAELKRLVAQTGHPFPKDINDTFRDLANKRFAEQTFGEKLQLVLDRHWGLLGRSLWPWTTTADDGPSKPGLSHIWQFLTLIGFAVAAGTALWVRTPYLRYMVVVGAIYGLVRLEFFVFMFGIEIRYLVETNILFEVSAVAGAVVLTKLLAGRSLAAKSVR